MSVANDTHTGAVTAPVPAKPAVPWLEQPALFRYGFVFSVGLSLLPIPVAALSWLVRLIF